ncbi:MAG: chorismate mutase [Spirochaetia bacterium]|nr:chorismate mutase [Spirochaetia bacterium]
MGKVSAVRGAVKIKSDTLEDIQFGVVSLFKEIKKQNSFMDQDVVSLIISQTEDLRSANSASLLRKSIPSFEIPLFCVQECECENSMPMVVRFLLHVNVQKSISMNHCYIHGAEILRPDLV